MTKKCSVDGQTVTIGDVVGFKSDHEQCGVISNMKRNSFGQVILTLEDEDGFSGDYIGGQTTTDVLACECWID